MKINKALQVLLVVSASLGSLVANAELQAIDDQELSNTVAQGGLYLSGEISLNEEGGPISDSHYGQCDEAGKTCGARFAYKIGSNPDNGWYVIDDWKGEISFEGLTIRSRKIDGNQRDITGQLVDSAGNPVAEADAVALGGDDGFGGDGASFDKEVLEIGLPGTLKFNDYQYKVGYASHSSPVGQANYQQTDIYGVYIDGNVEMTGNVLIFPTADR